MLNVAQGILSGHAAAVLDAMTEGLILSDADGHVVMMNPAALRIHGYSSMDEVRRHLSEFPDTFVIRDLEGRRIGLEEWPLARALRGEQFAGLELESSRADTGKTWIANYGGTPMRDAHGRVTGAIITMRDVTEQKHAERAVREAARHLRQVLDSLPTFVGVMTTAGVIVGVNRATLEVSGLEQADVVGVPFEEQRWWSYDRSVKQHISRAVERAAAGEAVRFDTRALVAGGRMLDIDLSVVPMRDESGRVTHLIPSAVDITERKRTEREREASEAHAQRRLAEIESIYAHTPVGLAVLDADLRWVRINHRLAEMNGIPPEAHLGKSVRELLPDIAPQAEAVLRRILETGEPVLGVEIEGQTPAQPGVRRTWVEHFLPLRDAAGNVVGVSVVCEEVTKRKADERELKQAKEAAEAASRAKDQFLAALSHELRTPLTPVLMTVGAMETEPGLPPAIRDDLKMIRTNIALEVRLIDDLLDISRVMNGKLALHRQVLSLHPLLAGVWEMVSSEAMSKRLDVRWELTAANDRIDADPARVQQVLWNLFKNAAKFTPREGSITVRTWNDDAGRLMLSVRDSGVGIEPGVLARLFRPFEQGGDGVHRQFGGLGLGLAISKAIVDMHGGEISAHSEGRGCGATLTVALPVVSAVEVNEGPVVPMVATPRVKRLRLLLVEDHADTLKTLRRMLDRAGHAVTTASTVEEAMGLAEAHTFDALVSDIGLPDGTGFDLMRELRARGTRFPGIALTGYGLEEDVRNSREAGFSMHITKPVDVKQLDAAIRSLTRKN